MELIAKENTKYPDKSNRQFLTKDKKYEVFPYWNNKIDEKFMIKDDEGADHYFDWKYYDKWFYSTIDIVKKNLDILLNG